MTESKEFSLIVKQIEGRCRHFNGIMSKVCDAGINYRELVGEPELDMALRLPCTNIKLKPRLGVTPQQQVKCHCWIGLRTRRPKPKPRICSKDQEKLCGQYRSLTGTLIVRS